jgi:hypothetical protein
MRTFPFLLPSGKHYCSALTNLLAECGFQFCQFLLSFSTVVERAIPLLSLFEQEQMFPKSFSVCSNAQKSSKAILEIAV